jgi:hypothetical protein
MVQKAMIHFNITSEDWAQDDRRWKNICNNLKNKIEGNLKDCSITSPAAGKIENDAKGEPITTGMFIISLAAAPAVVELVKCIEKYIKNLGTRRVKIELISGNERFTMDATGYSDADLQDLVNSVATEHRK